VNVGDPVEVMVLEANKATKRISLGMKQVEADPWTTIEERYKPGTRVSGKVRNLTDFGAFVELEPGVDGLLHISDMSWTRNIGHPSEILKKGQAIDTQILNVDRDNKRISLGLKQTTPDPWKVLVEDYPIGSIIEGTVTKLVPFGVFVELGRGVEGLVHISEMAKGHVETPDQVATVGQRVHVKVMDIDEERRRISLSMRSAAETLGFEIEIAGRPEGEEGEETEETEGSEAEAVEGTEEVEVSEEAAEVATAEEIATEDIAEATPAAVEEPAEAEVEAAEVADAGGDVEVVEEVVEEGADAVAADDVVPADEAVATDDDETKDADS
jgi:small subunit ribosomal protein S1